MAGKHPYQCILYCHREKGIPDIVIGASGSQLFAFNIKDGRLLCSWSSNQCTGGEDATRGIISAGAQRLPLKRKASSMATGSDSSSAEIVVNSATSTEVNANAIIKLTGTRDGCHVVAVTGEDKCIRVFNLSEGGILHLINERIMPKRPCAVILTPDESTILCADKFGDVYSMPLWGEVHVSTKEPAESNAAPRAFVPSATSHTVHTKRNRDALKQQLRSSHKKSEKKSLNFEHRLLLGHVSLLTDIACVSLPLTTGSKAREFILTSDRDEHIRVSRGLDQAYIINGYCLGHTHFVNRMCILRSRPELLISGGGDDFLVMWHWLKGAVVQKIDLKGPVSSFKGLYDASCGLSKEGTSPADDTVAKPKIASDGQSREVGHADDDPGERVAVSGIWSMEGPQVSKRKGHITILVACEATPALFVFKLIDSQLRYHSAIKCHGNVLDVAIMEFQEILLIAVDNVHKEFSSSILRSSKREDVSLLMRYSMPCQSAFDSHECDDSEKTSQDNSHALEEAMTQNAEDRSSAPQQNTAKGKSLQDLLYGLDGLRKRTLGGEGDPGEYL